MCRFPVQRVTLGIQLLESGQRVSDLKERAVLVIAQSPENLFRGGVQVHRLAALVQVVAVGLPQNYATVMTTNGPAFNQFFHAMLDAGVYYAPALYEAGFVSAAQSVADIDATVEAANA